MKRLVIYLVATFGLSWGLWIPAGFALGTFEAGEASSTLMIVLIAVGMFFSLIGALIANFACKPEKRIDLCFKPHIKGNVKHYLAAWFLPALISLLGIAVFYVLNPDRFDPTMMTYLEATAAPMGASIDELVTTMPPTPILIAGVLFSSLTYGPFINMIFAFGEEAGWRGMLFPTLAECMPVRAAAIVSGVIWGLWHAPIIAMGHNFGMGYSGFPIAGILVMMLTCTAFGSWLAILRLRTKSVWPCALAHGAFNAIANLGVMFNVGAIDIFGPSPLALVAGIPLLALGVICIVRIGRIPRGSSFEHAPQIRA